MPFVLLTLLIFITRFCVKQTKVELTKSTAVEPGRVSLLSKVIAITFEISAISRHRVSKFTSEPNCASHLLQWYCERLTHLAWLPIYGTKADNIASDGKPQNEASKLGLITYSTCLGKFH